MVIETKDAKTAEARVYEQFIGGEWVAGATGETYERKNPATGAPVETIPWGNVQDARQAIDAARAAFDSGTWSKAPATQRAQVLRNIAAKIRAELMPLAQLLSKEVGKPTNMAIGEIAMAADVYDYYAGLALANRLEPGDTARMGTVGDQIVLEPAPLGDAEAVRARTAALTANGGLVSPIWDALDAAAALLRPEGGRRGIVLVTDGRSTGNRLGFADVLARLRRDGIAVFVVSVDADEGTRPDPGVRLIAMTGYGRDEDRQAAREAGFDAHVLKPTEVDRLQELMDRMASQSHSELPRAG